MSAIPRRSFNNQSQFKHFWWEREPKRYQPRVPHLRLSRDGFHGRNGLPEPAGEWFFSLHFHPFFLKNNRPDLLPEKPELIHQVDSHAYLSFFFFCYRQITKLNIDSNPFAKGLSAILPATATLKGEPHSDDRNE